MANLTLAEYRNIVRGLVGQYRPSDSRAYPDKDINAALNAAQSDFLLLMDHDFFKKTATARDATAGSITMPADLLGSYTVTLCVSATDYRPLTMLDSEQLDLATPGWRVADAVDCPTNYVPGITSAGTEFVALYPPPTATITNGLRERYVPRPTDMSADSDTSVVANLFPHRQRRLLPYGSLVHLPHLEDGAEDDTAEKFAAAFRREVAECRAELGRRYVPNGKFGR